MYKNRVENDRFFFEIPGNSAENKVGKFKKYIRHFEFSRSGFPLSQDKRVAISFCHSLPYFHTDYKLQHRFSKKGGQKASSYFLPVLTAALI